MRGVPGGWKRTDVRAFYKQNTKEDTETMGPLVLLQVLGKSYSLPRNYHKANEAGDWESQHRFTRGKSWQINLITL